MLLLRYKPVQHVTVLNTVGSCNTMVSITILWGHCRICGPSLTETSLCGAHLYKLRARISLPTPCHDYHTTKEVFLTEVLATLASYAA